MALNIYTLGRLVLLLSLAGYANTSSAPLCPSCKDPVRSIDECRHRQTCHHDLVCAVSKALYSHGEVLYQFNCAKKDECDVNHAHHLYPHDAQLLCIGCCSDPHCYHDLCRKIVICDSVLGFWASGNEPYVGNSHGNMVVTKTPNQVPTSPQLGEHSCAVCQGIEDPKQCDQFEGCSDSQFCYTEVRNNLFYMSCKNYLHCFATSVISLIGKKRRRNEIHISIHGGFTTCDECCTEGHGCNKNLCLPTTSTLVPPTTVTTTPLPQTTTTTTMATTTTEAFTATRQNWLTTQGVVNDQCRNKEEDGISCSSLDLVHLCTDTSTIAYVLAHEKCPEHCGFCKSATPASPVHVTPPPDGVCADYEQDGILCSSLDLFNFCTGTSTLEYLISHKKCSQYCGFCTPVSG